MSLKSKTFKYLTWLSWISFLQVQGTSSNWGTEIFYFSLSWPSFHWQDRLCQQTLINSAKKKWTSPLVPRQTVIANTEKGGYTVTPDCFTGPGWDAAKVIIILLNKIHKIRLSTEERREGWRKWGWEGAGLKMKRSGRGWKGLKARRKWRRGVEANELERHSGKAGCCLFNSHC